MTWQRITVFVVKSIRKSPLNKLITNEPFWRTEVQTKEHTQYRFFPETVDTCIRECQVCQFFPVASMWNFCVTMKFNVLKLSLQNYYSTHQRIRCHLQCKCIVQEQFYQFVLPHMTGERIWRYFKCKCFTLEF